MATERTTRGATEYSTESHDDAGSKPRSKKRIRLMWLVYDIDKLKKDFAQSFTSLENITSSMDSFSEVDTFMDSLYENDRKKIIMLVSGALGENTVPIIHDAAQLDSVFVFCHNKAHHERWTNQWPKVKGVFNEIDTMCEAVIQAIQKSQPIRSRLTTVLPEPTSVVHRALTPQPPRRANDHDRPTVVDDQPHHRDRHRRGHSLMPTHAEVDTTASKQTLEKKPHRETVIDHQHDSFRKHDNNSFPLINSMTPATNRTSDSPTPLPPNLEQLRATLITTAEREIRKSMLTNAGTYGTASLNGDVIDRLQDTLVEAIEKRVPTKKDDSNLLNNLFAELKQALVDTLLQQQKEQPMILQDLIKQTVANALKEEQKSALVPTTTNGSTNRRKLTTIATSREIKIIADLKKTRTDVAFRQQRDAVVADKRLRNVVQQWSTVSTMADLVIMIKKYGTNDLECAWLLFCWIGQNVKYAPYCNSNAAETVFRTKQGVCRGFVSLYHTCCSLLDIECFEISGYAKQALVKSNEELKKSPHAWNSIVLDQYSYLIDPTWGAGGRDNENILEDFYFLTSPEEFIYTHYSNGSQLLEPEINKEEFLSLPLMKSTYYQLGLNLLTPKQGFNEINGNLFQIVIRTPEHVQLSAALKVGNDQYPRNLHTLCQRDEKQLDIYNCYIAPPVDGLYDIEIYGKTDNENSYRDTISMRLRVSNIVDAFTFPLTYLTFTEHHCILVRPLQRLVYKNEEVIIHMIIPNANVIKIQNGDDHIVPTKDEYRKGVLTKKLRVQGDLQVCGRWDDNADSISIICIFNMI